MPSHFLHKSFHPYLHQFSSWEMAFISPCFVGKLALLVPRHWLAHISQSGLLKQRTHSLAVQGGGSNHIFAYRFCDVVFVSILITDWFILHSGWTRQPSFSQSTLSYSHLTVFIDISSSHKPSQRPCWFEPNNLEDKGRLTYH
jgi:hypothetical protein